MELSHTPSMLARIAAELPESAQRVRSGPFAFVEHVWHMADLEREAFGLRIVRLALEALVLRSIAYGESDAVVHLLVRGRGRVSAFARAARSSRKRFGGALEPFQRVEALLSEREGQELWSLREARVLEAHARLRDDLHRIAHAGCAVELIHDLTRAGEPADALFSVLDEV